MTRVLMTILFAFMMATNCVAAETRAGMTADLILYNGKIVTVNQSFHIKQAIAIRGKNVLSVGSDEAIRALVGPDTRAIDLKGKTVIPGLIDGHYHFLNKAVSYHFGADVALVESIEQMVERIAEKVDQTPPGELVYTTSGWLPQQLKENRVPNRLDLDPVSPNHPVVVMGGHSVYLNSYALRQAGITRDTVAPEGGTIALDPDSGEPTGRLIENATRLARAKWTIGKVTHEKKLEAVKASQRALNAVGLTSIREPGIKAADMRVYQELRDTGELSVRVSMNYSLDTYASTEELVTQLETRC